MHSQQKKKKKCIYIRHDAVTSTTFNKSSFKKLITYHILQQSFGPKKTLLCIIKQEFKQWTTLYDLNASLYKD